MDQSNRSSLLLSDSRFRRFSWVLVAAAAFVLGDAGVASASVERVEATLSTLVQEQLAGDPASVASDEKDALLGADELPVGVRADLSSTDLDGVLVALGQGFGRFDDPTEATGANPREFGVEAACYSNVASLSYLVRSSAEETRRVRFATTQLPLTTTGTVVVESTFYLSGAVVLWSTDPDVALDDLLGQVTLKVTRDGDDLELFSTSLAVAGSGATADATTTGPILSEVVTLEDLAGEGMDDATRLVLERVEASGTLLVVAIPPQEHPYTYETSVNERFTLTARLDVEVRNAPEGTGVAATLGQPFENLGTFIEQGLPGSNGETLQQAINASVSKRAIGLVPERKAAAPMGPLCGAFGGELALLLPLGLLTGARFAGRRR